MKSVFWKLNFGILCIFKYFHIIKTDKLLWHDFSEIKFQKVNEISKIFISKSFPLHGIIGNSQISFNVTN